MRKRRLARCLLRADLAIEDGAVHEAADALHEARQLDPRSGEIVVLEQRLQPLLHPAADDPAGARERSFLTGAALGAVLLIAGAWAGERYLSGNPPAAASPPGAVATASLAPAPAVVEGGVAESPARVRITRETVTVPLAEPRIVDDLPGLPSVPGPPIAAAAPPLEPVVTAVNRPDAAPISPTPQPHGDLDLDALPRPALPPADVRPVAVFPAAAPLAAAGRDVASVASGDAAPARRSDTRPLDGAAGSADDSSVVRRVLERYEVAYSSLDAAAASAIWPKVNRDALARAFEGLASQQVSLGSCDVSVEGPSARATCAGSATWKPKIGGGVRTEPRQWSFELRKNGDAWRIERAIAR